MGTIRAWRSDPAVWQRAALALSVFLSGLLAAGLWVLAVAMMVRTLVGGAVSLGAVATVAVAAVVATWGASRLAEAREG